MTLKSLTLLLPQREIISYALPRWLEAVASGKGAPKLSSLGIICFQTSVINSSNLKDISQFLGSVSNFTLHGCNKLSNDDLLFLVKHCPRLKHLSLENISITSSFYANAASYLPELESLRTSHPGRKSTDPQQYYESLGVLVQACPKFRSFTHYLSGDTERGRHPPVPSSFVDTLLNACGGRLDKFEINGLSLSIDSVNSICFRAKKLKQLVIPVGSDDLVRRSTEIPYTQRLILNPQDDLQFSLLGLRCLRSLHVVAASTSPLLISLQGMLISSNAAVKRYVR